MKFDVAPGAVRKDDDMMRRRSTANKFIMLTLLLVSILALTGCRTRITNNSEVSNVYYDESGFLTETYQMRRDELGLSTAERPLLPNLGGATDTEDEFDNTEDETALQNYEPEEPEPYVEPPQTTTTTNNTTTNRSTSSGSTTYRRSYTRPSSDDDDEEEEVEITFNPGEGAIEGKGPGEVIVVSVNKNSSVMAPTAKREGYKLTGWKSTDGKLEIKPDAGTKVTADTTFIAQWEKIEGGTTPPSPPPETFQVRFVDGNKELSKQEVEKGKAATAPEKKPEKEGYTFKGWEPSDFSNVQGPMTIEAQWKKNTVYRKVSFNTDGGEEEQGLEIEEGKQIGNLPTPKRTNYHFKGWYIGDEEVTKNTVISEDVTITAKWDDWEKIFDTAALEVDAGDEKECLIVIDESIDGEEEFVNESCGVVSDNYNYVIKFADADKINEVYEELTNKDLHPEYQRKTVIVLSKAALKTENRYERILYKTVLLNALHGKLDVGEAERDIDIKADRKIKK